MDKIEWIYGDEATWTPAGSDVPQIAQVLFNRPHKEEDLIRVEYNPDCFLMEYRPSQLVGLRESANANNPETVQIKGVDYYVRRVDTKWDGYLYVAILVLVNP